MKKHFFKRFGSGIFCLIFILLSFTSCNDISSFQEQRTDTDISSKELLNEQSSFDRYIRDFFVSEVKSNTINLHYTLSHPKSFGIDHYSLALGEFSEKEQQENVAQIENVLAALSDFDYESLTTRQQLTCDILIDYFETERNASSYYYYNEPLRPTTGTHSELPILLAEYAFYTTSDITDYLTLLTCMEDYFNDIILFEEEKSRKGLFMSDFAADTVIAACDAFTENPEENYLISTFNSRIDGVTDLSDEKKELYKSQNQTLVLNNVIPAYEKLSSALTNLKGTGVNDAGLCRYPDGTEYYEYLVKSNTGSEKTVPKLQKLVDNQRISDINAFNTLLIQNPDLAEACENAAIDENDPSAILNHLQEKMLTDFMPAANTSYEINYVAESLQDTLAPAFYLTAPLDDISHNVIYINGKSNYTGIQLFTTLAHEGYPGHLYQTTASYQANLEPIRALLNYPGYVEGWATYVEMLSYHYADLEEDVADALMHNQSALLSLYATIDMGIHYDGWTFSDTLDFLKTYGIQDISTVQNIYELIVEEPSHYLKYYIGYLEFLELKEKVQNDYADNYSNKAFHQAIVQIGPAPFYILDDYIKDYYQTENDSAVKSNTSP